MVPKPPNKHAETFFPKPNVCAKLLPWLAGNQKLGNVLYRLTPNYRIKVVLAEVADTTGVCDKLRYVHCKRLIHRTHRDHNNACRTSATSTSLLQ